MQIRRCATVWLEPRELADFRLDDLLAGGTGVVSRLCWFAHAPHLGAAVEVDAAQVALLASLSAVDWVARAGLDARHGAGTVDAMLQAGLLLAHPETPCVRVDAAQADADFRAQGWFPVAALAHMACRWGGIDGPRSMAEHDLDTNAGLLRQHGAPPPPTGEQADGDDAIGLPRIAHDDFDALLDARATCRNFDASATLPLAVFSQVMARVFGARGIGRPAPEFTVYKRTSPSGGALHPIECLLIVQRVEGIAAGLYRYRIDGHALEPVVACVAPPQPGDLETRPLGDAAPTAWCAEELRAFARIAVAGQDFFADAPVLCVLAPRFHRNFWKYRNHAKAYRVCVLDAGHLSQTLQLCATRAGLGPFVTGAINELDLERAFGLTGFKQSPLVVCGFGPRAPAMTTSEFDPNRRVWPR